MILMTMIMILTITMTKTWMKILMMTNNMIMMTILTMTMMMIRMMMVMMMMMMVMALPLICLICNTTSQPTFGKRSDYDVDRNFSTQVLKVDHSKISKFRFLLWFSSPPRYQRDMAQQCAGTLQTFACAWRERKILRFNVQPIVLRGWQFDCLVARNQS